MMEMTPVWALAPYSEEEGPRTISTRSMASMGTGIPFRSKGAATMLNSGTPSTRTCTVRGLPAGLTPRMVMLARSPSSSHTWIDVARRSTSNSRKAPEALIWSAVMTSTAWGLSMAFWTRLEALSMGVFRRRSSSEASSSWAAWPKRRLPPAASTRTSLRLRANMASSKVDRGVVTSLSGPREES